MLFSTVTLTNTSCVVTVFQDYYKALEDADEKVQLANQIYDLVSNMKPVQGG